MSLLGAKTLSITTFSKMTCIMKGLYATLSMKGLYVTLIVNDTQHNNALYFAECHYDV